METEFVILEQKIDQLIRHSAALGESNRSLRERVAMLEAENRRLANKVSSATRKIELVLAMIPEEEN